MFIIYNVLQILLLPILFLFLPAILFLRRKDWGRFSARFGRQLKIAKKNTAQGPTFWIHALSVGEVTSAHPLVMGLRQRHPDSMIIVSAATRSGKKLADTIFQDLADAVLDSPFDLLPLVNRYLDCLRPDCFILVETDFWPNLLFSIQRRNIPSVLVNGRMSGRSYRNYRKFAFFFRPMFQSLSALCMQTEQDKSYMLDIGVDMEKLQTLGNLKLDTVLPAQDSAELARLIPARRTIFICGSTHPGEEPLLLRTYRKLLSEFPSLYIIVVPRNPARGAEIREISKQNGLRAAMRSENKEEDNDLLIVDTIGELTTLYGMADIAFVGGSITDNGGHNPIEPGIFGIPVLFGPHMEDFSELAAILVENGGAFTTYNETDLYEILWRLLHDSSAARLAGKSAQETVRSLQGVVTRHLELIDTFL